MQNKAILIFLISFGATAWGAAASSSGGPQGLDKVVTSLEQCYAKKFYPYINNPKIAGAVSLPGSALFMLGVFKSKEAADYFNRDFMPQAKEGLLNQLSSQPTEEDDMYLYTANRTHLLETAKKVREAMNLSPFQKLNNDSQFLSVALVHVLAKSKFAIFSIYADAYTNVQSSRTDSQYNDLWSEWINVGTDNSSKAFVQTQFATEYEQAFRQRGDLTNYVNQINGSALAVDLARTVAFLNVQNQLPVEEQLSEAAQSNQAENEVSGKLKTAKRKAKRSAKKHRRANGSDGKSKGKHKRKRKTASKETTNEMPGEAAHSQDGNKIVLATFQPSYFDLEDYRGNPIKE